MLEFDVKYIPTGYLTLTSQKLTLETTKCLCHEFFFTKSLSQELNEISTLGNVFVFVTGNSIALLYKIKITCTPNLSKLCFTYSMTGTKQDLS